MVGGRPLMSEAIRECYPEFAAAMTWVGAHYPDLLHPSLQAIVFVDDDSDVELEGLRGYFVVDETGTRIAIAERGVETRAYIDTIVHELSHLRQHVQDRPADEAEATAAGKAAAAQYMAARRREQER